MLLKVIIIDDEQDAVDSLELMLTEYCSGITIIGKAYSVIDAIKEIQNKKPDLVFLDVEMPHGTGFDVLDSIPDRTFEVIFVTAYNDYAIKALKSSAIDYLLKPMDVDELITAVNKVKNKLKEKHQESSIKSETADALISQSPKKIAIYTSDGVEFVDTSDIVRIEADGSYSNIFLNNKKKILSSKNLKEFQNILCKETFFRAHHSHLINLLKVKRFLRNEGLVEMHDGSMVSISRRNRDEFIQQMEKLAN
jgi:two-component system LytT family response regulator